MSLQTQWRYSGGADLILLSAFRQGNEVSLDLGAAMCLDLRAMKKAGTDPDVLFERIFRFSDEYAGGHPIVDLFFSEAKSSVKETAWSFVKELLGNLGIKDFDNIKHTIVTHIGNSRSKAVKAIGPPSMLDSYPKR
jgi:hypothetical protein